LKVALVASREADVPSWRLGFEHPAPELHLWLRVHDVLEDVFFAHVFEAPEGLPGLSAGDTYVVAADQIEDWMINVDGVVYGAYTLRLQRERLPELMRYEFDQHVGVRKFSDELP